MHSKASIGCLVLVAIVGATIWSLEAKAQDAPRNLTVAVYGPDGSINSDASVAMGEGSGGGTKGVMSPDGTCIVPTSGPKAALTVYHPEFGRAVHDFYVPDGPDVFVDVYFDAGGEAEFVINGQSTATASAAGSVAGLAENDVCSQALAIGVPSTTFGDTGLPGTTIDLNVPQCGTSITAPGVWYSVTGTGNTMTASTCNDLFGYDTKISVYCASCAVPTCVGGNDDNCSGGASGLLSTVTWCSQPGATYYILVHGFGMATGSFQLDVSDDGSACSADIECLPEGACCTSNGCSITTQFGCEATNGTYLGDDTNCGAAAGTPTIYEEDVDVAIPDDGGPANAVSRTLTVPDSFTIGDVDVDLIVTHTWIGDLIATLEHGGVSVTILDRPGGTGGSIGCGSNNLNIVLDDEGTGGPIEDQCVANLSSPPNYVPNQLLAAFDGMDAAGDWTLTISDNEGLDAGTLDHWSLHIDRPGVNPCGPLPPPRVSSSHKGSVLIYSKIEVKWDAAGNVIQDTILDISNDYPQDVVIQGYFVNGDIEIEQVLDTNGAVVQTYEPGWNTADCRFELTANQPHYWSAANGSDKCQHFTVLDDDGPGRVDPEATDGSLILRGYAVFWATKFDTDKGVWRPIHWNHIKGDAVLVNYANGTAWEYNAWAFQASDRTPAVPPSACTPGSDPYTFGSWVVCSADQQSAWISHTEPGVGAFYYPYTTCEELGYDSVGEIGRNCGNICGYCEDLTSCEDPGQRFFDGQGDLGPGAHGTLYGLFVTWECLNLKPVPLGHGEFINQDPGLIPLDGMQYSEPYASLIFDFYASGSTVLSGGGESVMVDTDLTLHAVSADLRQDGCGPVLTKVEAEIWNEFESKFSGTRRCICCWDQTMLSDWVRSAQVPNHFLREALRTDKGKARLDGVGSTECDYEELCGTTAKMKRWNNCIDTIERAVAGEAVIVDPFFDGSEDAAILGLATKFLAFSPSGNQDTAGMNLVGAGTEPASIQYDPMVGPEEVRIGDTVRNGAGNAKGANANRRSIRQGN